MFDIYYIGDNPAIADTFPFAKQISDVSEAKPRTRMFWLVEPNIEITNEDVFGYRPPAYDQSYTHVWKWNRSNYGGLQLLPVGESSGTKQINQVVCRKSFDVLRTTDTPKEYFDDNPFASYVWCVDPEYKIKDDIDWAPGNFEPNYIHCFHLRGQLEHKYPELEGGVKLYPRNWAECDTKYHNFIDSNTTYPVLRVTDPEDYTQRDIFDDDFVWLIDKEYQINNDTLDWVPSIFETGYIHSFRMPYQLKEKMWSSTHFEPDSRLGGIRLVPKDWKGAYDLIRGGVKIHSECPVEDVNYDVFYVDADSFTDETYHELSLRSKTEWFWVVDREMDFNGKLLFVPAEHEREYIHVFKLPGHLEERYPVDITEPSDNRCGGVRLVHRDFDTMVTHKYQAGVCPVKYDVFFTDDVTQYAVYARKSRTKMFWLVDAEHDIDTNFSYLPHRYDQKTIHNFRIPGQLTHRYPEKDGGVRLVPRDFDVNYIKYIDDPLVKTRAYPVLHVDRYDDAADQILSTLADHDAAWCWVIESDVDVLDSFSTTFTPDVWDAGKVHVWQKLNPVTGKQYDYGGVYLVPKERAKGRPKYIREPACTQKPYPVLYLEPDDIPEQLTSYAATCDSALFYAVDPFVSVDPDFGFSYYPTQWDVNNVHVFLSADDTYRGVRLYPVNTFQREYTITDIQDNSFDNLKQIATIASSPTVWPVVYLNDFSRDGVVNAILDTDADFVFTVDPDVDVIPSVIESGFLPDISKASRVHTWQRLNPEGNIHSYGGVRLWPTSMDVDKITTDAVRLNKMRNVHYVREPGSQYKPYDIIYISYYEPQAEARYQALTERYSNIKWVRDVEGIFNAHKKAAQLAETHMFWVIDADADVVEDFTFMHIPDQYDQDVVHVWNSRNPVTGAEYGYGGVKLFNREQVLDADSWGLDFTTGLSSRFKAMPELSCVTRFNTDAFSTWRSAFRECVKLALKDDAESKERLQAWQNPVSDALFAEYALQGAELGIIYAKQNADDSAALALINNFTWLKDHYEQNNNT